MSEMVLHNAGFVGEQRGLEGPTGRMLPSPGSATLGQTAGCGLRDVGCAGCGLVTGQQAGCGGSQRSLHLHLLTPPGHLLPRQHAIRQCLMHVGFQCGEMPRVLVSCLCRGYS